MILQISHTNSYQASIHRVKQSFFLAPSSLYSSLNSLARNSEEVYLCYFHLGKPIGLHLTVSAVNVSYEKENQPLMLYRKVSKAVLIVSMVTALNGETEGQSFLHNIILK